MSLPITNSKRLIGAHHHPQNERNKPISIFTSRPIRRLMFLILFILTILMFIKLTPSQHIQSIKSTSTDYLRQQFNAVKGGVTSGAGESCSAPPLNNQFNSPSNRTEKPKAAFIALVRDRQLGGLLATMRDVQIAFNDQPENGYDYIFLSEAKFSDFFKNSIKNFLEEFPSKPKVHFGVVPKEDWQVPSHIDMEKAKKRWETMGMSKVVPYGGSQTYRQMCRFYSGPIYHHELLKDYEYVWRIEPDTKHSCKYVSHWQKGQDGITRWIERDPFRHMKETGKKYGFIIAMHEFRITVKTLFVHVNKWRKDNAHLIPKDNLINFVSDDGMGFNMCHFWTNYEIIDLSFVRSNAYQSFFNHLDSVGGFFYERWGDAPVRSIAASLLLNKDEIWHVDYAGYFHPPYGTCPRNQDPNSQCACDPHMNVDYDLSHISCKAKWDDAIGNNSTDIIVKLSEENGFPGMTWDKLTPPFVPPPRRITD